MPQRTAHNFAVIEIQQSYLRTLKDKRTVAQEIESVGGQAKVRGQIDRLSVIKLNHLFESDPVKIPFHALEVTLGTIIGVSSGNSLSDALWK